MILNVFSDTKLKIKKDKKTFICLTFILALAVSMYLSFISINSILNESEKEYTNKTNVMDMVFYSNTYFYNSNLNDIKKIKGVNGVFLSKELDIKIKTSKSSKQTIMII